MQIEIRLDELRVVALGKREKPLQGRRIQEVIRLEDRQVTPARLVESAVHRRAVAGVGLVDHAEARIGQEPLDDVARTICRPVVDADDLDVGERLIAQRLQTLAQVALDVVDGHQDGDRGSGASDFTRIIVQRGALHRVDCCVHGRPGR